MKKIIITVVGKDTVGIIAKTSAYLARNDINILDISQTVVGGYFNMMMIFFMAAPLSAFQVRESGRRGRSRRVPSASARDSPP